jgi:lipopolysaccharide assembly protein A
MHPAEFRCAAEDHVAVHSLLSPCSNLSAALAALRKLIIFAVIAVFVLIAAVLTYGNREPISIEIGVMRIEEVSLTVAFAVAFALGALFGILCAGIALLRVSREKQLLRRELRSAEAELSSLRSMPLQDAN